MITTKEILNDLAGRQYLISELQRRMSAELKSKSKLSRNEKRLSANFLLEKWENSLWEAINAVGQVPCDWHKLKLMREEIDGGTEFVLLRPDGEFLVLNKLLPEGIRFKAGKAFYHAPLTETVCYDAGQLDCRSFLWALLHEVGHARTGNTLTELAVMFVDQSLSKYFIRLYSVRMLERLWQYRGPAERGASSYALTELKRLQEAEFPVLGPSGDAKIAAIYFDLALLTHLNIYLRSRAASNAALPALFEDLFVTGRIKPSFLSPNIKI